MFGGQELRRTELRGILSNKLHVLDWRKNEWTTLMVAGERPMARKEHAACLAKDKLFVFGGSVPGSAYDTRLNTCCFDAVLTEWTVVDLKRSVVETLNGLSAEYISARDEIIILGSSIEQRDYLGSYMFGVNSRILFQPVVKGEPPSRRYNHSSGIAGRMVYVYGGTSIYQGLRALYDLYLLHTFGATGLVWSKAQLSRVPPSRLSAASAVVRDKLIVFGGIRGTFSLNDVWAFCFIKQSWEELEWVPGMRVSGQYIETNKFRRRYGHTASVVENGNILSIGGALPFNESVTLVLNPEYP